MYINTFWNMWINYIYIYTYIYYSYFCTIHRHTFNAYIIKYVHTHKHTDIQTNVIIQYNIHTNINKNKNLYHNSWSLSNHNVTADIDSVTNDTTLASPCSFQSFLGALGFHNAIFFAKNWIIARRDYWVHSQLIAKTGFRPMRHFL